MRSRWVDKVWGKEEIFADHAEYGGKILHLDRRCRCSYHEHRRKAEHFYVLSGCVLMLVDGIEYTMFPGDSIEIPRNTLHSFEGLEDSKIIEVSTHDDPEDSFRRTKSVRLDA